jgi:hypothetical protein
MNTSTSTENRKRPFGKGQSLDVVLNSKKAHPAEASSLEKDNCWKNKGEILKKLIQSEELFQSPGYSSSDFRVVEVSFFIIDVKIHEVIFICDSSSNIHM